MNPLMLLFWKSMSRTTLRSAQIFDGGIKRLDLNTDESGAAVITKIIPGFGVEIDSTGVDPGTGDVTVRAVNNIIMAANGEPVSLVIGTPVYISGENTARKGKADALETVDIVGLVKDVSVDVNAAGEIQVDSVLVATTGQWDVVTGQDGGMTPYACYYLDPVNSGRITTVVPGMEGQYGVKIGRALSPTHLLIAIKQPIRLEYLTLSSILYGV